jgi:hypothetical protein
MEYNKDKTEASGKVGMVMNIKGTTFEVNPKVWTD